MNKLHDKKAIIKSDSGLFEVDGENRVVKSLDLISANSNVGK